MNQPMTPDEEYEFYTCPENQEPQGPGRRRLTATVPVRFPPELLEPVAEVLKARKRRRLSDGQRERLAEAGNGTRFHGVGA